ncbi:MAG: DUF885 domain-containing protein [Litorimonas sp.]
MRLLTTLMLGTTLVACSQTEPAADSNNTLAESVIEQSEDQNLRLDAWFEDKFMADLRKSPQALAALGIRERMDEWDDPSRSFALEGLDTTRRNLEELRQSFDFDSLDADHQLSYRLFENRAKLDIEGSQWWYHTYRFSQMRGIHNGTPTFLLNRHQITTVEDAQNYITRLNGVESYLNEMTAISKTAFEKGIAPPKFVYEYNLESARNILKGAPVDESGELNLLLKNFKNQVDELKISEDEREELFTSAIDALQGSVVPAYEAFIAEMTQQQSLASSDDGAWKLPDGPEYYAYRLRLMTTTDMSPSEIHDLGLSEMDRIHDEMRGIMKQVEFEGSLQEFFEFMRTDPQFTLPDTETGRADYLSQATEIIDTMELRLPEVFHRAPKAALEVRRVEEFREKAAGKAFYNLGSADGTRPGYYYANLYRMKDMPLYEMEALAYHEGIPGHHMQLSISQELEGIPKFRKYGRYTAYSEGWGLYSELLPKDMGFYSDPYSDFGRLAMELWRAARLVVDTGLHDKKWSREKAIEYLTTNTPNTPQACAKAIERYIVMPGQATAYKVGMLKILELRGMAETELGENYDIRDFHDVILASGPIPLNIMEERVKAYIAEKKAG